MVARLAGTNEPICASTAISAFCRRNVDLPAMLGPVSSQIFPASASAVRLQSLATNGSLSACSTTGWRPPSMTNSSDRSTTGRV